MIYVSYMHNDKNITTEFSTVEEAEEHAKEILQMFNSYIVHFLNKNWVFKYRMMFRDGRYLIKGERR